MTEKTSWRAVWSIGGEVYAGNVPAYDKPADIMHKPFAATSVQHIGRVTPRFAADWIRKGCDEPAEESATINGRHVAWIVRVDAE